MNLSFSIFCYHLFYFLNFCLNSSFFLILSFKIQILKLKLIGDFSHSVSLFSKEEGDPFSPCLIILISISVYIKFNHHHFIFLKWICEDLNK